MRFGLLAGCILLAGCEAKLPTPVSGEAAAVKPEGAASVGISFRPMTPLRKVCRSINFSALIVL